MTTTTLAPELVQLDRKLLAPHPDNPRKRFVDIDELAKSIAGVGVLEPLLVLPPNDEGVHLIVAGERRWRAAGKAKAASLPCVVRQMTEVEVVEAMLTENLQRSELTPVEEARAYQRLVDLDATVTSIAKKVGRTQPHVKGRLALLALPGKVLGHVDAGKVTLTAAAELLRWADDDDAMTVLAAELDKPSDWMWGREPDRAVARYINQRDRAREIEALRSKYSAKGIAIYEPAQSYWSPPYGLTMTGPVKVADTKLNVQAHAKESCHAVWIEDHYGSKPKPVPLCRNPRRHTTKAKASERSPLQMDPAVYADATRSAPKSKGEREAAAKKAIARDRLAFVQHHLTEVRRPLLDPLLAAVLVQTVGQETLKLAGKMLAPLVDGVPAEGYKLPKGVDWAEAATAALEDPRTAAAAELAIVLAVPEQRTTWCSRGTEISEYLLYLARHGYDLTGFELKYLENDDRDQDLPDAGDPHTSADVEASAPISLTGDLPLTELDELTARAADLPDGPELDEVNARIAELLGDDLGRSNAEEDLEAAG